MVINLSEDKPEIYNEVELIELASRIDSKSDVLNRDYTLAWTEAPLEIFGDKQIICAEMSVKILDKLDRIINKMVLHQILKDHNTEEITDEIKQEFIEKIPQYGQQVKDLLIMDLTTKMVFTRSHDGRVLKAAISKGERPQESQTDQKTVNALSKIFNKKSQQPQQEQSE